MPTLKIPELNTVFNLDSTLIASNDMVIITMAILNDLTKFLILFNYPNNIIINNIITSN